MDPKQRNYLLLALCAILVIGSWVLFVPPNKKITQGLDIRGGLSVILTAKPAAGADAHHRRHGPRRTHRAQPCQQARRL